MLRITDCSVPSPKQDIYKAPSRAQGTSLIHLWTLSRVWQKVLSWTLFSNMLKLSQKLHYSPKALRFSMLVSTHAKISKDVNTHRHFYKYKNMGNIRLLQYCLFEMYLKYDSLLFFYAGSYGQEVKLTFQCTPVHFHVRCCVCGGRQKTCPWSCKHVSTGL